MAQVTIYLEDSLLQVAREAATRQSVSLSSGGNQDRLSRQSNQVLIAATST